MDAAVAAAVPEAVTAEHCPSHHHQEVQHPSESLGSTMSEFIKYGQYQPLEDYEWYLQNNDIERYRAIVSKLGLRR